MGKQDCSTIARDTEESSDSIPKANCGKTHPDPDVTLAFRNRKLEMRVNTGEGKQLHCEISSTWLRLKKKKKIMHFFSTKEWFLL